MIYDYANQYWDNCPVSNPRPRVTIDQHLAWPETRIGYLLTWIDRPVEGWDASDLTQRMYEFLAIAEDQEAHF